MSISKYPLERKRSKTGSTSSGVFIFARGDRFDPMEAVPRTIFTRQRVHRPAVTPRFSATQILYCELTSRTCSTHPRRLDHAHTSPLSIQTSLRTIVDAWYRIPPYRAIRLVQEDGAVENYLLSPTTPQILGPKSGEANLGSTSRKRANPRLL